MNLPLDYKNRMKILLKEEYEEFLSCYDKQSLKGIRINTLKINEENFKKIFNIKLEKSKFSKDSFYIKEAVNSIGNHPLHHAGAFYCQEPSASSAVTILDPRPGENVLDLCAAPGGKSTQIAALLNEQGLLWSNEIIKNRAKILLSNIERMGIKNAVVSSCYPEILCERLSGFFDKVLVDAPCSGEGMFRKNPAAIDEWSVEHVKMCANRQLSILNTAAKALKENGIIVYSTCTFSKEENEQTIYNFLKENDDFVLEDIKCDFGRPAYYIDGSLNIDTRNARRIFPQDGGEGHFVAKLRKTSCSKNNFKFYNYKSGKSRDNKVGYDFFNEIFCCEPYGNIEKFSDNFIILPKGLPDMSGLGILRAGVLLANCKKTLLEPAHSAFMASKYNELKHKINFLWDSDKISAYLRGEEISIENNLKGYVGVYINELSLGYAKAVNGKLKNKYPKGLRNLK